MDPNHWDNIERQRAGVVQIPCAIDRLGQRSSPRNRLLDAQAKCSERLQILSDVLVTRIELEGKRAVGVRVVPQAHLYRADPNAQDDAGDLSDKAIVIRCQHEVILSAGSFNTPQLLMLSGIGDPEFLRDVKDVSLVHELRGVGHNLQDRYEVSVQSTMRKPFASLAGVTLTSDSRLAHTDRALEQYIQSMEQASSSRPSVAPGIYSSNGALVGLLFRSQQEDNVADMFIMALAGQFSGYRVGWSRPEALIPGLATLPAGELAQHRTVSWLILKARTKNCAGYVRIKSSDPTQRPEINFRSFSLNNDTAAPSSGAQDVLAIEEGVRFVEEILSKGTQSGDIAAVHFPGRSEGQSIQDWIRQTAWGHHACGTCKLGRDDDELAVVNSRFQIRGLQGLRIVDASVFPRIPGYFIATNVYMIAEKAADVLTEDHPRTADQLMAAEAIGHSPPVIESRGSERQRQIFPREFEAAEAALVRNRRKAAGR